MSDPLHDATQAKMYVQQLPRTGVPHLGSTTLAMELTAARQRLAALEAELAAARATGLAWKAMGEFPYPFMPVLLLYRRTGESASRIGVARCNVARNIWKWGEFSNKEVDWDNIVAVAWAEVPDPAAVAAAVAEGRGA